MSMSDKETILNLKNEIIILKNTIHNYEKLMNDKKNSISLLQEQIEAKFKEQFKEQSKKQKKIMNQLIEKLISDIYELDMFNTKGVLVDPNEIITS